MSTDPISGSLHPTIIYSPTKPGIPDVSAGKVALIGGDQVHFSDEISVLLRDRLRAASIVISLVFGASFILNVFWNYPFLGLRAILLAVVIGCAVQLHRFTSLTMRQLRLFEMAVFGAAVVALHLGTWGLLVRFAESGNVVAAIAWKRQFLAGYSVLLLTYGLFIPNSWRRAAAILLPATCLPYLLFLALHWTHGELDPILEADWSAHTLPIPPMAALIAIYGSHTIQQIRRDAFKAKQFGQYVLKRKIGGGGMGEVYEAEHMLLKRPCAIKLISRDRDTDERALARFELEVRATAKLSHWNTVEIYDYGRIDDGTFYYVMELLRGLSLDDLVRQYGPMPPERAVYLLRQVCRALREAHATGLIHRDIKPANIFAAERGGVYDVAKLLDFGLVKHRLKVGEQEADEPDAFSGSPLYMAPEQATNYEGVDARTDIYAVGVVAYFLVTGQPPFQGSNIPEVLDAHARGPVVPPSQLRPGIPADLERVILRCLAKLPADRFPDAASLEAALAACACADEWTERRAAEWWLGIAVRKANPSAGLTRDVTLPVRSPIREGA
jgi:eukaryotic-like serine/threonine-protein kinase